ncbi:IucA/IucC family protein [Streptomyces zagrosensis]|uniref:Siderophore synthetase component n=1 Tax=Streptomyces zagrosensis TaxID=1042984 RepID=A0A7W9Q9V0_9ACTN|nr:IucA/IucC family siderophore biosynthesis protein [Streptomyces zagrosensis]MBB5936296.1 siderophore synthetase component [Streptomyces zagrosensis]
MSTAHRGNRDAGRSRAPYDAIEGDLLLRVLNALLREDAYGLRSGARTVRRADGDLLRLALPAGALLLPIEADGFQCEVRASRPVGETEDGTLAGMRAVLGRLRSAAGAADRAGFDAFVAECEQELATLRLHAAARPGVVAELAARYGPRPAQQWRGLAGSLAYDTLAAHRDHPVYPTARTRPGLSAAGLSAHAPEFHPEFALRWIAVPRAAVCHGDGPLPTWWPTPSTLGLPDADEPQLVLPVHPLTVGPPLTAALRAAGLAGRATLAPRPWLRVRPTLSARTVAVTDDPAIHLKLPLGTATLGRRNRRTIKPGTLIDGAAGQRLTALVIAREPRFAHSILLADEHTHLHAGHELLATLVRRYPPGLDAAQVVPVAALLASCPDGSLVADALAARFYGGDLLAFLDAYLTLLFDWHTTLFGYGVGLEAHQQNTSLVLDEAAGRPRLRLLIKDHDGPRVHTRRLAVRLASGRLDSPALGFDDSRILVGDDGPVADVFTTIAVHLCAGALVFELGRIGRARLGTLMDLLRDRLTEAIDQLDATPAPADALAPAVIGASAPLVPSARFAGSAGSVIRALPAPGAVLRERVLDADRLPVKAMVTAGTLLAKERSGAADINKHYVSGPNYLLRTSRWSR